MLIVIGLWRIWSSASSTASDSGSTPSTSEHLGATESSTTFRAQAAVPNEMKKSFVDRGEIIPPVSGKRVAEGGGSGEAPAYAETPSPGGPTIQLNGVAGGGAHMPMIGLGTCCRPDSKGERFVAAVKEWFGAGGVLVDTAQNYKNQPDVRKALDGLDRSKVWLTSKVAMGTVTPALVNDQVRDNVDLSLSELGTDRVELMLLHMAGCEDNMHKEAEEARRHFAKSGVSRRGDVDPPAAAARCTIDAWRALLEQQKLGKCISVGVSNFGIRHLRAIQEAGLPLPAVNEVEFHPWISKEQKRLVEWCHRHEIAVIAYGSLGSYRLARKGGMNQVPKFIAAAAQRRGVSSHQVLLAWAMHQNVSIIPGTNKPDHMSANLATYKVKLTNSELKEFSTIKSAPKDWRDWGNIIHNLKA
ncbi:hypothetical protein CYMTET_43460 [Cymbomonas tetramitiformis]|uniref:NADP-dependent oxidoreductase domain-containing protein n=1 Tax=Cymbomonas tetramitiformis TaxID=36881 RepID=A0AAE0F0L3_9CHLO|nr:hypothetical protein CYMTET_43460 [Cymbomonas tetramitiformis]|eukprot:gene23655-28663_t